jgi:hypothetical protein
VFALLLNVCYDASTIQSYLVSETEAVTVPKVHGESVFHYFKILSENRSFNHADSLV